jgi:hypothetical protein
MLRQYYLPFFFFFTSFLFLFLFLQFNFLLACVHRARIARFFLWSRGRWIEFSNHIMACSVTGKDKVGPAKVFFGCLCLCVCVCVQSHEGRTLHSSPLFIYLFLLLFFLGRLWHKTPGLRRETSTPSLKNTKMYKMKSKKHREHEAFGWSFFIRNIDEKKWQLPFFVIVTDFYDGQSIPFTQEQIFFF